MSDDGLIECPGCKGTVPETEGPTHAYIGSNAGCWALYGDVLAREYGDFASFSQAHRLTVDAYAVQHPGKPDRRTTQSVTLHLVSLYLILEKGMSPTAATQAMAKLTKSADLEWLDPPANPGEIKVTDIWLTENPVDHARLVQAWARLVWMAWKPHHARIAELAESVV